MNLPAPTTLNNLQLTQQHCALCNRRLFRDRLLGRVTYRERGQRVTVELWACAPDCRTAVRR